MHSLTCSESPVWTRFLACDALFHALVVGRGAAIENLVERAKSDCCRYIYIYQHVYIVRHSDELDGRVGVVGLLSRSPFY